MSQAKDPIILAIETATRAGGVSLTRGANVLASRTGDAQSSHSTDLLENIDHVLREARVDLKSIDLFAAAVGPGSFTGLRIGLATTKSLAVALHRKCAGVSTLAAIAYQAGQSERTVALLPAGRGELFAQMFSVVADKVTPLDGAKHLSPDQLIAKFGGYRRVCWVGEGAQVQVNTLKAEASARSARFSIGGSFSSEGTEAHWIVTPPAENVANAVAQLALQQGRSGALVSPESLQANYVRPSDAEIKSKS